MKTTLRVRSWGPILALPPLVALQALAPTPVVMMCLVILVGLLVTSLIWVVDLRTSLRSERTRRRDWVHTGELLREEFAIHNRSWLPVPWAEVCNENDLPGYDLRRAMAVPALGAVRWTAGVVCNRRGVYTLGPLCLRTGDPFGLFDVTLSFPTESTFTVYPVVTATPLIEQPAARLYGTLRSHQRSFAQTVDVTGIRLYAAGDPLNHVHWRSTAHRSTSERDEFMVKEFEHEALTDFWIILDLDASMHLGEEDLSTEEYAVRLAASLGYQMLQKHRQVGLIACGAEPLVLLPRRDLSQLDQILSTLAGVRADGIVALDQVLAQQTLQIRSGAHCAVITPSNEHAWTDGLSDILSRSIRVTPFLLDGRPFGGDDDMRATAERLASIGVPSQIVGEALYSLLNPSPCAAAAEWLEDLDDLDAPPPSPSQRRDAEARPVRASMVGFQTGVGGAAQ